MRRIHVFADEAGDFNFSVAPGASRYFILTTVTLEDCSVGDTLLALRRQLAWEGVEQGTADFCCWAIQRKWERGDERSYVLIRNKVRSEFEPFRRGQTLYY